MPRGQRADAAVGQADQDAAGVSRRGPGRIAVAEKRGGLDLEFRPGADGIGSAAGRQGRDRKPRLERLARQIHGRRQPGKQGRRAVRPRRAAVPERRRHGRVGAAGIFLGMQNRVRSAVRDVGEAGLALRTGLVGPPDHQGIRSRNRTRRTNPIDRHDAARTDARVRRAKEDRHRLAVDGVVARVIHRRSVRPAAGMPRCRGQLR